MSFDQQLSRVAFLKLDRQLAKLKNHPAAGNVHKFRTYGRRVEALLDELIPKLTRSDRKLLKLLARLRRKAGKVRDLDVQLAILRNFKVPQDRERKVHLIGLLTEERTQREKKLLAAFDKETVRELRRRLKRASEEEIPETADPLEVALRHLQTLGRDRGPLTEKILHQYRIMGKRSRYLAEVAGEDPAARQVVAQLKRMQDVVGDWHDWLKLTQRAESMFGGVQDSPLVAALRNVTQAKFRNAVAILTETRAGLSSRKAPAAQAPAKPTAGTERNLRSANAAVA